MITSTSDKHGPDERFSPLDYPLASSAGCINVAGHIAAEEIDIDIEGLEITACGMFNPAGSSPTSARGRFQGH